MIESIFEALRFASRFLWGLIVVLALLLWGPLSFTKTLGLSLIVSQNRPYFGATFALLLAMLLTKVFVAAKNSIGEFQQKKAAIKRLRDLTEEEKSVLRPYIIEGRRTRNLSPMSGVVAELEHNNILYRSRNIGTIASLPYNIQPWAYDYLRAHQQWLTPQATEKLTNSSPVR